MKLKKIFEVDAQDFKVEKAEVELEDALDRAGAGKYQVFHSLLMWATLITSLLEMIGYAYILPAAGCDLEIPDAMKGILTSIPNIGIIVTAPFWGRIADSWGRKPALFTSTLLGGFVGLVSAFMPDLISFAICKSLCSLFLSCPTSLGYAYAGEMTPRKRRDFVVLVCNGLLTVSSIFSPLFAWATLSFDWEFPLGAITLRPWRLLTAVYALPMILTAIWLTQAMESPKFLLAKGRKKEALDVLRHIYVFNTGKSPESFGVISLKSEEYEKSPSGELVTSKSNDESAFALVKPPHLKWFALLAFLMFGLYTSLNGLWLFATDTINKVLLETSDEGGTLCLLINKPDNQTTSANCTDTISQQTFKIMLSTTATYAVVVLLGSISPVSKKVILVAMYLVTGAACIIAGVLTNKLVASAAMSALQITALGIGPLLAYAVELFPTTLRGTAVGAALMFGRAGSVAGANVAGYLLAAACTTTFYGFAGLLFLCGGLTFILPGSKPLSPSADGIDAENDRR